MTPQQALNNWIWKNARILPDKEPTYIGRIMAVVTIVCICHAVYWGF